MIPLESCSDAAKVLIDYFGPEDLRNVVGGEKWWQIRGIAGVQGEWIAQSKDWKAARKHEKAQEKGAEAERMKAKRDPRHERADTWNTTGTSATSTAHASQRSAPRPEINIEETDEEDDPTEANDDGEDNSNVPIEELDRLKRVMVRGQLSCAVLRRIVRSLHIPLIIVCNAALRTRRSVLLGIHQYAQVPDHPLRAQIWRSCLCCQLPQSTSVSLAVPSARCPGGL